MGCHALPSVPQRGLNLFMPRTHRSDPEYEARIQAALELSTEGTVTELTLRIKAHLIAHPELASSDQFSGLFGCCHRLVR